MKNKVNLKKLERLVVESEKKLKANGYTTEEDIEKLVEEAISSVRKAKK
ncbi:hypothetical protein HZC09_06315 [Candidatus Micrarchaeota archaeon]|nr:hypothetical protein [Candidatus Micrarchaeota archaeon]